MPVLNSRAWTHSARCIAVAHVSKETVAKLAQDLAACKHQSVSPTAVQAREPSELHACHSDKEARCKDGGLAGEAVAWALAETILTAEQEKSGGPGEVCPSPRCQPDNDGAWPCLPFEPLAELVHHSKLLELSASGGCDRSAIDLVASCICDGRGCCLAEGGKIECGSPMGPASGVLRAARAALRQQPLDASCSTQ